LPQNQKHNYIEYILTKNINSNLHHHRNISYSVEQLGVKCLAQGHIGVSQWIRTRVSHTKGL